jgi:hypothetical protein
MTDWGSFEIPVGRSGIQIPTFLLTELNPPVISLFPKLKMKLKGWRFETASDIYRESQSVLD